MGTWKEDDPLTSLKLIDFGLATSYVKKESLFTQPENEKFHIDQEKVDFCGNNAFCSPSAIYGLCTSRRDDMFSILYMLIYLKTGRLPFFDLNINHR